MRWLPAIITGILSVTAFMWIGHTPLIRALGLALAAAGVTLTLQRFGRGLAIIGGLALAFSPAFWSQTGGSDNPTLNLIAIILVIAGGATLLVAWLGHKPTLGIAIGLVIFALLFWTMTGTPRSLRLTTLFSAWLLYLLTDGLLGANPRPDEPAPVQLTRRHTMGILLLLALGILNDPLLTLLTPAVVLGLVLSKAKLSRGYWLIMMIIVIIGLRGIAAAYLDSGWWLYPAAQAQVQHIQVPYAMADGWRETGRWVSLFTLVIGQFTMAGLLLGTLGLSRLARWYPPLGIVTMAAYAAYALFGLMYFGKDSAVLLLPLLMIQVIWMTYAAHSFSHWLQKSLSPSVHSIRWLAPAAFSLLPLALLLRIAGYA